MLNHWALTLTPFLLVPILVLIGNQILRLGQSLWIVVLGGVGVLLFQRTLLLNEAGWLSFLGYAMDWSWGITPAIKTANEQVVVVAVSVLNLVECTCIGILSGRIIIKRFPINL